MEFALPLASVPPKRLVVGSTTTDMLGPDPAVTVFDSRFPKGSKPYCSAHWSCEGWGQTGIAQSAAVARRFSESYVYAIVSPLAAMYIEPILPLLVPVGYV